MSLVWTHQVLIGLHPNPAPRHKDTKSRLNSHLARIHVPGSHSKRNNNKFQHNIWIPVGILANTRKNGRATRGTDCSGICVKDQVSPQAISRRHCSGHRRQTRQVCTNIQQLGIVRHLRKVASSRSGANIEQMVLQRQSGCGALRLQRAAGAVRRSNRP